MKASKNILAIALAAIALASCEEGPAGIFSRVADETSTTDTMTEAIETASPTFVVRLGTTYYSGMATLWQKADGASTWTQADTSGVSGKTVIAGAGAATSTRLYVAFTEASSRDDLGVWYTSDGTSWTAASGLPTDERVKAVLSANDTVFVVTGNVRSDTDDVATYTIYSSTGTAFAVTGISETTNTGDEANDIGAPTAVAWNGSMYLFTAGGKLISGVDPAGLAVIASGPADWGDIDDPTTYGGVCADGTGFIVSGRYGKLYYSPDGSSWTASSSAYADSDDDAYSLSTPTYIAYGTNKILVVGTNGKPRTSSDVPPTEGYLEFDYSGGFAADLEEVAAHTLITNATNFASSLADQSVNGMPLFDPGDGTLKLFAMTDGDGLWSNTYSGTWGGWVRE